jgi:hypothetical protein
MESRHLMGFYIYFRKPFMETCIYLAVADAPPLFNGAYEVVAVNHIS